MKKGLFHSLYILIFLLVPISCHQGKGINIESVRSECQSLLKESREDLSGQEYQEAMDLAMGALAIAEKNDFNDLKAEALCAVAHIDVATSHDANGWEYASMAEEIARREGLDQMCARALNIKARICILAQVSPETGRDDEAITLLREAVSLSRQGGYKPELMEALFNLSQAYVNKNRFNDVLDMEYYQTAGECLDEAEILAQESGDPSDMSKAVAYRMRYFRQGGRIDEAISYCDRIISESSEEDHLMRMQVYDFLTSMYAQKDDIASSLESHNLSTQAMSNYYLKSSEKKLLEIETKYETSIKDQRIKNMRYQILSLVLLMIVLAFSLLWLYTHNQSIKRRNIELQKANNVKEELITFMSKDLRNPLSAQKNAVTELAGQCLTMPEEEVRRRCDDLVSTTEALTENVADYMTSIIMARSSAAANLGLTKRELEVLRLSADGLTVKEIADKLCISDRTVGNHRAHIFDKMDVSNISEMISKASKYGII